MAEQETEQVTPEPEGEPDMTAPFFVEPKAEPELEPEPTPEPEPDKPAAEPPKPTVDKDAMLAQVLEQNKALAEKVAALETPETPDPEIAPEDVDYDALTTNDLVKVLSGGTAAVIRAERERFSEAMNQQKTDLSVLAFSASKPDFKEYEDGDNGFRHFFTTTTWPMEKCYEMAKQMKAATTPPADAPPAPGEPAAPAPTPTPAARPTGPARPGHEAGGQKPPKPKAPKFNTIEEAAQWHFKQKYAELARKGEIMQLRDDIPEEE